SSNASFTQSGATATNGATAAGDPTLNFAATPSWVVAKMVVANATTPASIPAGTLVDSTTATTAVMTANATAPGVGNGDEVIFCSLPVFTTTAGTSAVSVFLVGHGVSAGGTVVFAVSTSGNGVTIGGSYTVLSVVDANNFVIQANTEASASGSFVMNNGNAQLVYSITLGPLPAGTGYGLGLYGAGAYGFGTASSSVQTGTTITATDWTIDNWGKLVIACPKGGPIYYWDPQGGFLNASVISSGPPFNSGIFVSMSQQILVAYGSSVEEDLGHQHQHMLVQWSTVGDFLDWTPRAGNQAGNFVIPIGSRIVAGLPGANQNLIWTDLDLWAMNYIGPPNVFGFNKIGAGAGAVSAHAVQQLRGSTFWMGRTNFYAYTAGGVNTLPCPIWDVVFQNLNTDFLQNVRAMPNTPFNEVGWLYPSAASTSGECDSYVKMNITEQGAPWDYGPLPRSAWIDQTILGMPIGASPQGFIYQHESGNNADGAPLTSTFTTGDFYLAEGEDFVFVDQIIPDFKWTTYTGTTSAAVQLTFLVSDFPGDDPRVFGPYTVTSATQYITVRFRGRLMRVVVASSDLDSFWRLGTIKYRYGPAVGRR
ncbi:MAG TPA: hypothetical protein VHC20_06825, partial [Candidatus Paceibacterota bacterium]|nr:hypothetical protein [Candidatus Paceibacterota bacterium]